jgi:hypothetical protein
MEVTVGEKDLTIDGKIELIWKHKNGFFDMPGIIQPFQDYIFLIGDGVYMLGSDGASIWESRAKPGRMICGHAIRPGVVGIDEVNVYSVLDEIQERGTAIFSQSSRESGNVMNAREFGAIVMALMEHEKGGIGYIMSDGMLQIVGRKSVYEYDPNQHFLNKIQQPAQLALEHTKNKSEEITELYNTAFHWNQFDFRSHVIPHDGRLIEPDPIVYYERYKERDAMFGQGRYFINENASFYVPSNFYMQSITTHKDDVFVVTNRHVYSFRLINP